MADSWTGFVRELDRCWLEGRFDELQSYLAHDMVLVAPGGKERIEGCAAVIDTYREFMSRARVEHLDAHAVLSTERGETAVLEYSWGMAWESDGTRHQATGREILVAARRSGAWKIVWRTQVPN